MNTIDNLIIQVEESSFPKWQWITALNYEDLGYSEEMVGCVEVASIYSDQIEKKIILSHDDEFDVFFANYGISSIDHSGVLK